MMFAAGFGTRMKHLTADKPKPMVHVAERPLFDHALDLVRAVDPQRVVANLHYKPDLLERHLAGQNITLIREKPHILDTGGGLRNALPALGDGPVWTVNTDAIWDGPNPLARLLEAWRPGEMDALLIAIPPAQAVGYKGAGDFTMDENGRLSRGPGLIYGGVQIIKTDRLSDVPNDAFSLNVIWNDMLGDGRLFGLRYAGRWCDVGHPGGVALAEKMLKDRHV